MTVLAFPAARTASPRWVSCADTAKLVRVALKAAFPAVKFSVKSKNYAGGASITVRWVDGPTTARVESVAKQFAGASFDGMTDSKDYHTSETPEGETVHYAADFVFCEREASDAHFAKVSELVARMWGVETVPARRDAHSVYVRNAGEYFGTLVHRAMQDRASVAN